MSYRRRRRPPTTSAPPTPLTPSRTRNKITPGETPRRCPLSFHAPDIVPSYCSPTPIRWHPGAFVHAIDARAHVRSTGIPGQFLPDLVQWFEYFLRRGHIMCRSIVIHQLVVFSRNCTLTFDRPPLFPASAGFPPACSGLDAAVHVCLRRLRQRVVCMASLKRVATQVVCMVELSSGSSTGAPPLTMSGGS